MRAVDPLNTEFYGGRRRQFRPQVGQRYHAASGIGGEVREVAHLADNSGTDNADAGRQRGKACCEAKRLRSTRK